MVLRVNQLTKEFKRGNTSFFAVKNAGLSVYPGDFVSIIGRSGSGKTTLLNLIAGLLKPTSGSIEIGGKDISSFNDAEASRYRNAIIGYVPQGQSLLANLTVLDNVRLPFYFFRREGDVTKKAMTLLEQVGIPHLAHMYPRQLSGGEMRRVAIARALINDPAVLLADEPTSDLDVQTTAEMMKLFREISMNGTAVLMVTHDLEAIHEEARIFRMEAGVLNGQA
ncbi:MAG TPA: ABC transporter ATP-binding protein [Thermoclostridium caenicola]|nr:ABC transporter ATP-binding protein [Thermoclostridium caenicola]